MSSTLQRLFEFASIVLLSAALVGCGGSDTADGSAKNGKSAVEAAGSAVKDASAAAGSAVKDAVESAGAVVKDKAEAVGSSVKEAVGSAGAVAAAGPDLDAGKETYGRFCFSCHAAGVAGAPKLGDKEAWAPRLAKGLDMLVASTISGVPPAMPARGLCMSCSDLELRDAVAWMIAQ